MKQRRTVHNSCNQTRGMVAPCRGAVCQSLGKTWVQRRTHLPSQRGKVADCPLLAIPYHSAEQDCAGAAWLGGARAYKRTAGQNQEQYAHQHCI